MRTTRHPKTPDSLCRLGITMLLMGLGTALWPWPAAAQTPPTRRLTVNQVRSATWPTVTVNFNLSSLDKTPLGEVRAEQFAVEENGQPQQVTGLALGGAVEVSRLAVVLVVDTSGSM